MLEYLRLENTGPAPELAMELGPRLNLIAGDNGLGKSFLLDVAWWALSGHWPSLLNPRLNRGYPARSREWPKEPQIEFACSDGRRRRGMFRGSDWLHPPGDVMTADRDMVIYAQAGGAFAVWDPDRRIGAVPSVFTEDEVWNGLKTRRPSGEELTVCNGLLNDWSRWIADGGENARLMVDVLGALAPVGDQTAHIRVGKPERLSDEDARFVPTIGTAYADSVPVLYTSAAMRRVCTFAYMLTWAWSEHLLGALGRTTSRVVLLYDEVEGHLHPQWQRAMLPGLLRVFDCLGVQGQLVATTHSPLVLASVEPHFSDDDRLFHLDFADGCVRLEQLPWAKQGDALNWLVSEVFGLKQARSIEAERAINAAQAFMRGDTHLPDGLDSAESIDEELKRVLAGHDPFWPRWVVWAERDANG